MELSNLIYTLTAPAVYQECTHTHTPRHTQTHSCRLTRAVSTGAPPASPRQLRRGALTLVLGASRRGSGAVSSTGKVASCLLRCVGTLDFPLQSCGLCLVLALHGWRCLFAGWLKPALFLTALFWEVITDVKPDRSEFKPDYFEEACFYQQQSLVLMLIFISGDSFRPRFQFPMNFWTGSCEKTDVVSEQPGWSTSMCFRKELNERKQAVKTNSKSKVKLRGKKRALKEKQRLDQKHLASWPHISPVFPWLPRPGRFR